MQWLRRASWGIRGSFQPAVAAASLLACGLSAAGLAQDDAEPIELALDVTGMVSEQAVLADTAEGVLWTVEPNLGRVLVQVPMTLSVTGELAEDITLSEPTITLAGGRFVCWRLEVEGHAGGQQSGFDGFEGGEFDGFEQDGGGFNLNDELGAGTTQTAALPEGAPLMTRRLIVTPDGKVTWSLDRSISGGSLPDVRGQLRGGAFSPGDFYVLRMSPERLAALEPERPSANTTARDTRPTPEQAQRQREQEAEYRRALRDYQSLRGRVRDLPDTFEVMAPVRVWAVYEVPETMETLVVQGSEPLPWELPLFGWLTLREQMERGASQPPQPGADLRQEQIDLLREVVFMGTNDHPYTHRILAEVLSHTGLAGVAMPGDQLYDVISDLVNSTDTRAQETIIVALANAPATPGSARLLSQALPHMSADSQVEALRGLLSPRSGQASSGLDRWRQVATTAAPFLENDSGPDAGRVIEEVVAAVSGPRQRLDDEGLAYMVSAFDFERMPEARRAQAIAYIVAHGDDPLCAAWLDQSLLNARDEALVEDTLTAMAEAAGIDLSLRPTVWLPSLDHGWFALLNASEAETAALAWQSVGLLAVGTLDTNRSQAAAGESPADMIKAVLDLGLSADEHPAGLAAFVVRSHDAEAAALGLVRLVMDGDETVVAEAAEALVGSELPVDRVLATLRDEDRARFVARVYRGIKGEVPLVVGVLVSDQSEQAGGWFARHLTTIGLPRRADWVASLRDEAALLALVNGPSAMGSLGAADALVASAGGTEAVSEEVRTRLRAAGESELAEAWRNEKRRIFGQRLEDAAGTYKLVLTVYNPDASSSDQDTSARIEEFGEFEEGEFAEGGFEQTPAAPAAPAPVEMQRIEIALVELLVEDGEVSLADQALSIRVSEDAPVIEVPAVRELWNYGLADLDGLPLRNVRETVALSPTDDGGWAGQFPLIGNDYAVLALEPLPGEGDADQAEPSSDVAEDDEDPVPGAEEEADPAGDEPGDGEAA